MTLSGYHMRFGRCGDVLIDRDLRRLLCRLDPRCAPELMGVLTGGSVLAFLLTLRGHLALHASAVTDGVTTVAIVGPSGSGKSTLAAVLCAGGRSLLSDDVLRIDLDGLPLVHPGADELRLRPKAQTITQLMGEGCDVRPTVDGRFAVRPEAIAQSSSVLDAIVVPRPRAGAVRIHATRLRGIAAMLAMASATRLIGWGDESINRRSFEQVAALVERVPVIEMEVPWGPPFDPAVGDRLFDAVATTAPVT